MNSRGEAKKKTITYTGNLSIYALKHDENKKITNIYSKKKKEKETILFYYIFRQK